jgi:hypothetical protein
MKQYVYEVLLEVGKKRSKEEKIKVLKENESWALKDVLKGTLDDKIQWLIPEGDPPYQPSEAHNHPSNLLKENKKFAYFAKGGPGTKLPAFKRENLFVGLIEGIHPEDAKVVINMINKMPLKGITKPIVEEAFPGLLNA